MKIFNMKLLLSSLALTSPFLSIQTQASELHTIDEKMNIKRPPNLESLDVQMNPQQNAFLLLKEILEPSFPISTSLRPEKPFQLNNRQRNENKVDPLKVSQLDLYVKPSIFLAPFARIFVCFPIGLLCFDLSPFLFLNQQMCAASIA